MDLLYENLLIRRKVLKIVKVLVLLVCILFTGCREYGEKRIVSTVVVDNDKVLLYYYDFSQENPVFLKEEKQNTGIENTLTDLLSHNDYNLKLCKYAVVSEDIVDGRINEMFYALTDNRFATDVVIIEGDTGLSAEDYEKINKKDYPVYNYRVKNNSINAVVEKMSSEEKKIIIENKTYRELDSSQSFVFDVITNVSDGGNYIIKHNEKTIAAELEKPDTFFHIKNNILYMNITAVLKSYKGVPADIYNKEWVRSLLEKDMYYQVKNLIEDKIITENFDLIWYGKVGSFNDIKIEVNIL